MFSADDLATAVGVDVAEVFRWHQHHMIPTTVDFVAGLPQWPDELAAVVVERATTAKNDGVAATS